MKLRSNSWLLLLAVAAWLPAAHASPAPEFCKVLRAFVASVQPDETREFTFRTSWGSNFKDDPEPAIAAKRCEHGGYNPAKNVCTYLMEYGSTEFTGADVKAAVSCLSRKTKFDRRLSLYLASFHFSYGSDDRGALIDITFKEDPIVGGMAFRLVADGY
ncbi:MAG: hypothetical protein EON60_13015 [Alphaproteobacteria bacterium]|nr:MAG: hypothetical protein EON60_13015 [Alphaproteobacteria bacterium]